MDFIWIDYSDTYYRLIKKLPIPPHRKGKFVQLDNAETEYLIVSPKELSVYHANIIDRFCNTHEIKGHNNKQRNMYTISDPDWDILGGGEWEIDDALKQLYLFGTSLAYGQFSGFNVKKNLHSVSSLEGYEIHLRPPPGP